MPHLQNKEGNNETKISFQLPDIVLYLLETKGKLIFSDDKNDYLLVKLKK